MPAKKASSSKATKKTPSRKKAASPKGRAATKKTKTTKSTKAGDREVTIDRRKEETADSPKPAVERRTKVQRRRQIDPTTCERDYSLQEVEFMNAMDHYKRTSGRMFPTCSEVLEVIRGMGYVQLTPAEMALVRPEPVAEEDSLQREQDLETEEFAFEDETLSV